MCPTPTVIPTLFTSGVKISIFLSLWKASQSDSPNSRIGSPRSLSRRITYTNKKHIQLVASKITVKEMLIFHLDSLPVVTVSLAASLLLAPVLTLDQLRWMAHPLPSYQSSEQCGGKRNKLKLLVGCRCEIKVQNLQMGYVGEKICNVFMR